jgi:hypothetical protein
MVARLDKGVSIDCVRSRIVYHISFLAVRAMELQGR